MDLTPSTPSYKTRPIKPLIYSRLVTSTPENHQASKRVKGLLGYSEHYKGNRMENANTERGFLLQSRDYRRTRELSLELWNSLKKSEYLEKFLKSQKNIQSIRIKVLGKESRNEKEDLKLFWKALWRVHWLNRVHIDFEKEQTRKAISSLRVVRYMGPLPKLKDLAITLDGEEVYPFSASLLKVGFDVNNGSILVKDVSVLQKLIKRTPKFDQLDTIKIDSKQLICFPDKFLDGLVLVISKLPNFKELDFNFSRDIYPPMKQTFNILDVLVKAPKLEIFRMGVQMKGVSQISMLKHPVFKIKSLKRTHLSLFLYREITPANLNEILNLLKGIPSLYELSLDFSNYPHMSDEIAESLMKKIIEMTSIRKLKIINPHTENLSAKQAGNILNWIFNHMHLLEELDLRLPNNGLDFAGNNDLDIQGLPRLVKASIVLRECESQMEKNIWGVIGIFGKCLRLKELNLDLTGSVHDFSGTPRKFFETFRKLKGLQIFKLQINSAPHDAAVGLLKDFIEIFGRMRNLQDFSLLFGISYVRNANEKQELQKVYDAVESNKKYRFFDFGHSLLYSLRQNYLF